MINVENKLTTLIVPPDMKFDFTFFSSSGEIIFKQTLANETLNPITIPVHFPIKYERFKAKRMPLSKK
ncbi:hypothetical protein OF864_00675 [Bacillus cereus]|uniref:hypothetical protein n=1 Tax=Bacillus TaxID=1386 RepID=UPI0024BAB51C|nr:hypothetical protein [Bacillus cereus]WHS75937.1 hypothetical protein OF864_00675 [Bacillus cereus]